MPRPNEAAPDFRYADADDGDLHLESGAKVYAGDTQIAPVSVDGVLAASEIVNTPAGSIAATNVQSALNEIDAEKSPSTNPQLILAPVADDTYTGQTIFGYVNSGGVTQWDAVYMNGSSQWVKADANGAGAFPARGLAITTESTAVAVTVLINGVVRNDAFNFTPGATLYLSETAGGITETAPVTSGSAVQAVGFALTADIAVFDFDSTVVVLA